MRVSQEGKQISPAQKAINTVVKKQGKQVIPHNSTKDKTATSNKVHKFTNFLTGMEEERDQIYLLRLAAKYVAWASELKQPVLLQTFWSANGIQMKTVEGLCKAIPEFASTVEFARQLVAERHGEALQNDMQNLRNRAPIYIQEYHDYDIQKFEFMERFKQGLEQSGLLSLDQIQAAMQVCFPKTPKPEGWRDPRERIEAKREVEE
jgi:hypothetical protein